MAVVLFKDEGSKIMGAVFESCKLMSGKKCPVPFVRSTRRASSWQMVPDTYFPLRVFRG